MLDQVLVLDAGSVNVKSINARQTIGNARKWLAEGPEATTHQGFPVLDRNKTLIGFITRSDVMAVYQKRVQESELQDSTIGFSCNSNRSNR